MTKISNYNIRVTGADLARALKDFHSTGKTRTAGMEVERFLLTRGGDLPDASAHDALYLDLRRLLGDKVSIEPGAHMIEVKTDVHTNAAALRADLAQTLAVLEKTAAAHGLRLTPASDLPGFTPAQLTGNLVSGTDPETGKTRRTPVLVKTYNRLGWHAISAWGASTTSIQFTHAVTDADHLLRWSRVHAALTPLYFAAFENRERTAEGVHTGLSIRRAMNERGLVADYVFAARDGGDFADRFADFAARNEIVSLLDENGEDAALDQPCAFTALPPERQTLGNLLQAASLSWNVTKIKPVFNEAALAHGDVALSNLLLEVRDMDVSDDAVTAIAGWFCALTESEATLRAAEDGLEALGIPVVSDPVRAGRLTAAALRAVEATPQALGVPFGNVCVRDVINGLVLPLLQGRDPAGAEPLWRKAAEARAAPFRTGPSPAP